MTLLSPVRARFTRLPIPLQLIVIATSILLVAIILAGYSRTPFVAIVALLAIPMMLTGMVFVVAAVQKALCVVARDRAAAEVVRASQEGRFTPGVVTENRDPVWSVALDKAQHRADAIRARGRDLLAADEDVAAVPLSLGDRVALTDLQERLTSLRAEHPSMVVKERIAEAEAQAHQLVGEADSGVRVDRLFARLRVDRDFLAVVDCVSGHVDAHSVVDVFVVPGGKRRVERVCVHCKPKTVWTERMK